MTASRFLAGNLGLILGTILFIRECILRRPRRRLYSQLLTILTPWVLLRVRWSISVVSTLVTASRFLTWNREAEVNFTNSSSLLLFNIFLSFLFFYLLSDIVPSLLPVGFTL